MTKQKFFGIGSICGIKFCSTMDEIEGNPNRNTPWTLSVLFGESCLHTVESDDAYPIRTCKPIIRHMSTLTEPITHKGETFVPTERLKWDDSYVEVYHKNEINANEAIFSDVLKLIEWGYWPDMPEGEEVVYVTEEFNPYK